MVGIILLIIFVVLLAYTLDCQCKKVSKARVIIIKLLKRCNFEIDDDSDLKEKVEEFLEE